MCGEISPQLPVILRIAVRTFLTFRESVHAIMTSSPDITVVSRRYSRSFNAIIPGNSAMGRYERFNAGRKSGEPGEAFLAQ